MYNAAGLVTSKTDALGNTTDYEYNSRNWLTKTTLPDPDGAGSLTRTEITYGYDAAGNMTSEGVRPSRRPRANTYDDAGR